MTTHEPQPEHARTLSAPDVGAADRAFSLKAAEYDAMAETHPIVIWMRNRIRQLVEKHCPEKGKILELNAGSGLDAAYFAAQGYRVHATDVAQGMLAATAEKALLPSSGGRLTQQSLSFTDVDRVEGAPYDLVFSNLGGLNCIEDLTDVTGLLPKILYPGSKVVWVIMPPLCPWELAQALRGDTRTATRRLKAGGFAHIEGGQDVRVWYHSVGRTAAGLGPRFDIIDVRSYGLFSPPSFFEGFIRRHPRLTSALTRLDDLLARRWPFNRAGDFYAITARFRG